MATEHAETERKYEGPCLPERLDGLPGVAATERAEAQDLDAVYYDTPDLRLLRRRITLRRRSGGTDPGWHLKLPLDADSRQEVHLPPDGSSPHDVPTPLATRIAAFTRGAAVLPVAHLRTDRARQLLLDDAGEILAEVTEDRVAARILDPAAVTGAPAGGLAAPPAGRAGGATTEVSGWTEFEVELKHGTRALLEQADTAFTEAGLVRSSWPSKLARALGRAGPPEPQPPGPVPADGAGTAGDIVMEGFRAQLARLLALDAAVRGGQEDSVHQMRVTARRLRSLLKAHRRLFDRRRTGPLAAQLRRLGRLLGRARDQEVLAEQLVNGLDAVPAQMRQGALRAQITQRYTRGYRRAWEHAVAELDSPQYFTLLDDLDAFAAHPPLRHRAARDARRYLSDILRREQKRTLRRLDKALRTEPGPQRDQALHRARKAAKRARYTAQCAQPATPRRVAKRLAKFANRAKKLHKVLGVHQDSVVARRVLITLGSEGTAEDRHAFAFGVLHERQRLAAADALRQLPRLRRRAGRRKLAELT
ncbi:CYTH and CHAD domain-containing protein [Streptomyces sp. NRRL WC-3742]|uniref:CYTH and CHAD domain-containing protein n=1 Tax=Streptomyces sp. NRRL WC-3742 TaxID=1463934 RepID=UPI0004CB5F6C|nr:CYTH and CHAD domain-containing protein [Streptomyces sp. NRRL WC-3742]